MVNKNGVSFEQKKVTGRDCPEFRVSFENIHKPKAFADGQEPKYSLTMLFSKKTNLEPLKRAAHMACVELWGEDQKKWPKNLRTPFRDGDQESDQPGYAGMIFVRASSKEKPQLIDQRLEPIASDENGRNVFYSGCYARASLIAFAYDTNGNRGVSFSVLSVQKTRDGERFGGRRPVAEEFDTVDDGSNDESSYSTNSGASREVDSSASMGF